MNAPDHRPYLTENDLRTPEDVALWLSKRCLASDEAFVSRGQTLDEAFWDLSDRLDRERRQACRRAALENWRNFAQYARWCKERGAVPKDENEAMVLRVLAKTIAYRDAARQP